MEKERRQAESDLELGKQHMLELLENIAKVQMHPDEKLSEFHELIRDISRDLKHTQGDLDLKQLFRNIRRRLDDLNASPSGATRPQDREEIKLLHHELQKIPIDVIED